MKDGFFACALAQRFEADGELPTLAASGEVSKVHEDLRRPVVALGLLRGHEAVDLGPQLGLPADEAVEVPLPGDGRLALTSGLLLGALLGVEAPALRSVGVGRLEKLAHVLPLGAGLGLPARSLRNRCSSSAIWAWSASATRFVMSSSFSLVESLPTQTRSSSRSRRVSAIGGLALAPYATGRRRCAGTRPGSPGRR